MIDLFDNNPDKNLGKLRIVQESVPGKEVTLAHIIASPDEVIYHKLGLDPNVDYQQAAIAIMACCPCETTVIAGDIAMKTSKIEMGFLVFTGEVSSVRSAVKACATAMGETGEIISHCVIPAPHKDLVKQLLAQ